MCYTSTPVLSAATDYVNNRRHSWWHTDLNDIFDMFSVNKITPQLNTNQTAFTKAVTTMSDYFNPRQNVEFQRYQLRHIPIKSSTSLLISITHASCKSRQCVISWTQTPNWNHSWLLVVPTTKQHEKDWATPLDNMLQFCENIGINRQTTQDVLSNCNDKQTSRRSAKAKTINMLSTTEADNTYLFQLQRQLATSGRTTTLSSPPRHMYAMPQA